MQCLAELRGDSNPRKETHMAISCLLLLLTLALVGFGLIDVSSEEIVTFSQLARRLPRRRNDRPVHVSTIHRWRIHGVKGARLECVKIGGGWCTSMEAFQRWVDQLTAIQTGDEPSPASPQQGRGRNKRDEDTERQ